MVGDILYEAVLLDGEYIERVDIRYGNIVDGLNAFHTNKGNVYPAIVASGDVGIASISYGDKLAYLSGRIGSLGGPRLTQLKLYFTGC